MLIAPSIPFFFWLYSNALVCKSLEFYIERKNTLPINANKSKAWKTTSNNVIVMLHGWKEANIRSGLDTPDMICVWKPP
jgi:hypothetical protein